MSPTSKTVLEEQKLQKEIDKLEREIEKSETELSDLRKPHWKRPLTIAAFLPSFVAVISLLIFTANGFFGVQIQKLQNEKFEAQKTLDLLTVAKTRQKRAYLADSTIYKSIIQESKKRANGYEARTRILERTASEQMSTAMQQQALLRRKLALTVRNANQLQDSLYKANRDLTISLKQSDNMRLNLAHMLVEREALKTYLKDTQAKLAEAESRH